MADSRRFRALLHPSSPYFGTVEGQFIGRIFVNSAKQFRRDLFALVNDVAEGRISGEAFQARALRRVREVFLFAYSLGALSINPFHTVTQRDVKIVDQEINGERQFLRQFGNDLQRGFLTLDPETRANLYVRSLRGMFELGRVEAMPGPFLWVLGDTDHCDPCIRVAAGGPYQRERYSGLGYPALPGIPGSGSICQGLTRCGCYLRLASGILMNQDLQEDLRAMLDEVVHGG